ncbi:MAG: hypothetical protein JWN40_2739 [Phycisphaerales bacterium]|nr:hypothetical protein [Phycisphaerales bacterium]
MADESHVIRGINWRETFPFTQIFRAFRVAIHPTKLILALVALLALYGGGRILDMIWPVQHRAIPKEVNYTDRESPRDMNEVEVYGAFRTTAKYANFEAMRDERRRAIEEDYVQLLRDDLKIQTDTDQAKKMAASASGLGQVKEKLLERRNQRETEAAKLRTDALAAAKTSDEKDKIEKAYRQHVVEIKNDTSNKYRHARMVAGEGVFIQFFNYEVNQVNNVVWAVLANDWLGGFGGSPSLRERPGVLASISNFCVTGPWWMARYHTTYFILFILLFSIVWAIFGGAIARIAAVHVARDEKISLSAALRFSTSKFLSFIFAPIIPLLIVLVVGLVVMLGGLVGNIPWIGPILVGLFFFLAIAAGFVMTLVLLGTGGGFNLMYPTIAVEGSDSFDAISRSFSYVYARPWRMLFYTLVAVLYGALCYVFVRFFIQIMLILTHHFVGAGMFVNVDGGRVPLDLWNTMWPAPETHGFTYDVDWLTLGPAQSLAAFLVSFWVYLTVGMLGAFAISFYFSANTIIYYLMRREVDATELDDVYLEQSEEDFGDTAPAAAAAPNAPAPAGAPAGNGGAQIFPTGEPPPAATPPAT